ncbi:6167_t:CDS:10, partial [Acaulospora colombiana]
CPVHHIGHPVMNVGWHTAVQTPLVTFVPIPEYWQTPTAVNVHKYRRRGDRVSNSLMESELWLTIQIEHEEVLALRACPERCVIIGLAILHSVVFAFGTLVQVRPSCVVSLHRILQPRIRTSEPLARASIDNIASVPVTFFREDSAQELDVLVDAPEKDLLPPLLSSVAFEMEIAESRRTRDAKREQYVLVGGGGKLGEVSKKGEQSEIEGQLILWWRLAESSCLRETTLQVTGKKCTHIAAGRGSVGQVLEMAIVWYTGIREQGIRATIFKKMVEADIFCLLTRTATREGKNGREGSKWQTRVHEQPGHACIYTNNQTAQRRGTWVHGEGWLNAACGCSYLLLLQRVEADEFDHLLVLILLRVDDRNHDDNEQYDDTEDHDECPLIWQKPNISALNGECTISTGIKTAKPSA